jgi:hypothetical protein
MTVEHNNMFRNINVAACFGIAKALEHFKKEYTNCWKSNSFVVLGGHFYCYLRADRHTTTPIGAFLSLFVTVALNKNEAFLSRRVK